MTVKDGSAEGAECTLRTSIPQGLFRPFRARASFVIQSQGRCPPAYFISRLQRESEMKLSKDKRSFIYNDFLTLSGIPPEVV